MQGMIERSIALASQWIISPFLRLLFFFFGRLSVEGRENIHRIPSRSFILISNHVSFLDPFLVPVLFPFTTRFFPFRFPATPFHYYTWKKPFMWILGSYPLFKGKSLNMSLSKSLSILLSGGRIFMFPQGKIQRKGRKPNARRGVAYLAAKAGVPIIPCVIEGFNPFSEYLGFSWKKFFLRHYHLKVRFGRPFFIQQVYGKIPKTKAEYRDAAQKAMERVYDLKAPNPYGIQTIYHRRYCHLDFWRRGNTTSK